MRRGYFSARALSVASSGMRGCATQTAPSMLQAASNGTKDTQALMPKRSGRFSCTTSSSETQAATLIYACPMPRAEASAFHRAKPCGPSARLCVVVSQRSVGRPPRRGGFQETPPDWPYMSVGGVRAAPFSRVPGTTTAPLISRRARPLLRRRLHAPKLTVRSPPLSGNCQRPADSLRRHRSVCGGAELRSWLPSTRFFSERR